jgi:DNA-binding response OmpR family regulator
MAQHADTWRKLLGTSELSAAEHLVLQLLMAAEGDVISEKEIVLIAFGVFSNRCDPKRVPALIASLRRQIAHVPELRILESADGRGYKIEFVGD